ncbi:hypothetical protein Tco_0597241 [Tanacetum coccineum]
MFKILKPNLKLVELWKIHLTGLLNPILNRITQRFCYKDDDEHDRNQCHVTNHQVNVQFLLQLQPEWQRKSTNLPTTTFELHQTPVELIKDNSPRINRGTGYDIRGVNVFWGNGKKPKRVKDAAYHKEKMLLCKQEEAGVQLNAEQVNWKDDTDDESDDQELEAHYMYMAQLQEVTPDFIDNSRTNLWR